MTFLRRTNIIRNPSARLQTASPQLKGRLGFWHGATSQLIAFGTLARSRITWKRSSSKAPRTRAAFTRSTRTICAMHGSRRFCQSSRLCRYKHYKSAVACRAQRSRRFARGDVRTQSTSGNFKILSKMAKQMGVKQDKLFDLTGRTASINEIEPGIEEDDTSADTPITEPFDPNLVRMETTQPTIDLVLQRIALNEIDLNPGFQRKGGIWNDTTQSRLIESILVRIPLPAFYFDATDDDKWLVVDGLQRLITLKRFVIDRSLRLKDMEFLTNLDGKRYDDLTRNIQRRINETQLQLIEFSRVRLHLLNTPCSNALIRVACRCPLKRFATRLTKGRQATYLANWQKRQNSGSQRTSVFAMIAWVIGNAFCDLSRSFECHTNRTKRATSIVS